MPLRTKERASSMSKSERKKEKEGRHPLGLWRRRPVEVSDQSRKGREKDQIPYIRREEKSISYTEGGKATSKSFRKNPKKKGNRCEKEKAASVPNSLKEKP